MSSRPRRALTGPQLEAMVRQAVLQFLVHGLGVPEVRLLMDTPSDGMDIRCLSRPDMGVFVGMKKRRIATNTYASLVMLAADTDEAAPIWQLTPLGVDLCMALRNGTF
jgi:hypothetical protein